jgi:hypothetical protein
MNDSAMCDTEMNFKFLKMHKQYHRSEGEVEHEISQGRINYKFVETVAYET